MKTKELKKLDRSGGIQGSNESKNIIKLIPHIRKKLLAIVITN